MEGGFHNQTNCSSHKLFSTANNTTWMILDQSKLNLTTTQALKKIEMLMTAESDTIDGNRLDVLVTLIEAYEQEYYPFNHLIPLKPSNK
jgi:hypothetical protein